MSVYDQSISNGFRLHEEFIAEDSLSCKYKNYNEFKIKLLHMDLRKKPCLNQYFPPEINNQSTDTNLVGSVVLQIVSIVNMAQPSKRKYDESNPRLLEIQLSDGHIKVHAIEIEYLSDIKASTPPGTKLLYHGGKVVKGKLLLQPSNCEFLGGGVSHLFEAYQANVNAMRFRSIQRSGSKSKSNALAFKSALDPPRFELKLISHPASTLLLSTSAPPPASLTNSAVGAEPTANKGNSALKGGKAKTAPVASGSVNLTSVSTERTPRERTPRERISTKESKVEQVNPIQETSQQHSVNGKSVVREKTPRERLPPNNQQQQQQQQSVNQASPHSTQITSHQQNPQAHDGGRGSRGGRGGAAGRGRGRAGDDIIATSGGYHQQDSLHKASSGSRDSTTVHDATTAVSKMSLNHISSQPTNAVQLTAPTVTSVSADTATSATKGVFRQLDKPQQGGRSEETSDAQYFRGRGGGRGRGRGRRGRDFEGTDEGDGAEPKAAPLSVFEAALLTATISNTAHKGNKSHGSASKSSGLKAKGSGSGGLPWGCKVCTYMNHCDLMSCEICEAPK